MAFTLRLCETQEKAIEEIQAKMSFKTKSACIVYLLWVGIVETNKRDDININKIINPDT